MLWMISTFLLGWPEEAPALPLPVPVSAERAFAPKCGGALAQGGLVICDGPDGTVFDVNGVRKAVEGGPVSFGLRRDAPETLAATVTAPGRPAATQVLSIGPREDDFRTIDGLDCDKVDARTPEQKAHAGRSWQSKQAAFATFASGPGAGEGFARPSAGPMSSPFGPTRRYIGVGKDGEPCDKTRVHRGYDIATPVGTPVLAPASGLVTLADPDLYYEGGTVFLDHGDGLVSVFMHLSELHVEAGARVEQGELLADTGNTGRTTGPHLHWAVKWRDTESSDRRGDFYIDPALLLDIPPLELEG